MEKALAVRAEMTDMVHDLQTKGYHEFANGNVISNYVYSGRAGGRHQYLAVVELLLSFVLLRPVSAEDDVDLPVNVRESSSSSLLLLMGSSWFFWSSPRRRRR